MRMIKVLEGIVAVRATKGWIAWDTRGPMPGTESPNPYRTIAKAKRIQALAHPAPEGTR